MPFIAKHAKTWKTRVVAPSGRQAICSTGCQREKDAQAVERVVKLWQGAQGQQFARPDVLELVVGKRVSLADAVTAHHAGTLDALVREITTADSDVDLWPHVAAWHTERQTARKGAATAHVYLRQLETLWPRGERFTLAGFTRREILARLKSLAVEAPTRNRYKAAVSSFAQYLIDQELLELNVVRTIPSFGEHRPRVVYLERPDAERVIGGLPQPYAGIAAAMCGFGMEWTAIERARVEDFQLDAEPPKARVRGTKRDSRDRWVPLVRENRWVLPYLRAALKGRLPAAPAFEGVPEWRMLRVQYETMSTLGVVACGAEEFGPHTLHDWRSTHTVQLLRDGYSEQVAAAHLGHANTTMVRTRYGLFRPSAFDYAKATAAPAADQTGKTGTTDA